jgi:hypothetical protein
MIPLVQPFNSGGSYPRDNDWMRSRSETCSVPGIGINRQALARERCWRERTNSSSKTLSGRTQLLRLRAALLEPAGEIGAMLWVVRILDLVLPCATVARRLG